MRRRLDPPRPAVHPASKLSPRVVTRGAPRGGRASALRGAGLVFIVAAGAACGAPEDHRGEQSDFDRAVLAALAKEGLTPERAGDGELCTRLFIDALGVRPTRAELEAQCIDRPIEEVIAALTARDEFRWERRRRFADRLQYNDAMIDRDSIRALDALVDRLYRGELGYRDFAIETLAHPGFVGRFLAYSDGREDTVAEAAFTAFLGRPATAAEAEDLAPLWSAWRPRFIDPATLPPGDTSRYAAPLIDPYACEAGTRACVSTLLGVAAVEFPRDGRSGLLNMDALTAADWEALRAPGSLLVDQPTFWEAAADEVLRTYFGWDFGAALPEAREALIAELRENGGDLRALEHAVMASAAYAFAAPATASSSATATARSGTPRYAYGPTKFLSPEAWLKSAAVFTGAHLEDCDFRVPNLPDTALRDPWFRTAARAMGGCPGAFDEQTAQTAKRAIAPGIEESVARDEAALELCARQPPPGPSDTRESIIERALENAFSRAPTPEDVADLAAAAATGCADCTAHELSTDLCIGLLGGVEYATY